MKRGRLITIGSFDGVHVGHQALLARAVQEAKKRGLKSLALTFDVPPKMVLDPTLAHRILSTTKEKEQLLKSYCLDEVMVLPFNQRIANLKAFAFFKSILIDKLKAKGIVVGADFRFGMGRNAGALELVRWGEEFEIPVWVISAVKRGRKVVSSSTIRQLLEHGQFKKALVYLGHPYLIGGPVVTGRKLGRRLGFPTANIKTPPHKILPRGVFAVRGRILNSRRPSFEGVCNIGTRPTVSRGAKMSVEVHIFGDPPRLTGKTLQIELVSRLRGERKFKNVNQLKRAIASDVYQAKAELSALQTHGSTL